MLLVLGSLLNDQRSVEMLCEELDGVTCFLLAVGKRAYIGKHIDKHERTARSIGTLLAATGMKVGHCYTLNILEGKQNYAWVISGTSMKAAARVFFSLSPNRHLVWS